MRGGGKTGGGEGGNERGLGFGDCGGGRDGGVEHRQGGRVECELGRGGGEGGWW